MTQAFDDLREAQQERHARLKEEFANNGGEVKLAGVPNIPGAVVAAGAVLGTQLARASQASFAAASRASEFVVKLKHLSNDGGSWNKFAPGTMHRNYSGGHSTQRARAFIQ